MGQTINEWKHAFKCKGLVCGKQTHDFMSNARLTKNAEKRFFYQTDVARCSHTRFSIKARTKNSILDNRNVHTTVLTKKRKTTKNNKQTKRKEKKNKQKLSQCLIVIYWLICLLEKALNFLRDISSRNLMLKHWVIVACLTDVKCHPVHLIRVIFFLSFMINGGVTESYHFGLVILGSQPHGFKPIQGQDGQERLIAQYQEQIRECFCKSISSYTNSASSKINDSKNNCISIENMIWCNEKLLLRSTWNYKHINYYTQTYRERVFVVFYDETHNYDYI